LKAVEGRAGIKNQLVVDGPLNVNPEVEEVLFHVAQEALNNALKHAHAAEVRVNLRQDELGSITLIVKDNGQGFELETAAEGSGLGLISMRERVEKLSGTISYQSTPGRGTEIQILLPVNNVGRS
jgi:two-component system sensor histidine kinase DegS